MKPRTLRSLRVRLPVLAMAVLAASLAVATVLAYKLLLVSGYANLDGTLERERERFQQSITSIVERVDARGRGGNDTLRTAVQEYLRLGPPTDSYLTVVRLDGDRVFTDRGGGSELQPLRQSGGIPFSTPGRLKTIDSPVGELRSLSATVSLSGQELAAFQVLAPLKPIHDRTLRALRWLALAALISLAIGGAVLFTALRRTLVPLSALAVAARNTELGSLTRRVPEPDLQDEVGSLAREFNTMLARLESASESERQFMATVSHELRTPITIARGHIETLEAIGMHDEEAVTETVAVVRDELLRMGRLVEDLMALARSGTDEFIQRSRVELPAFFVDLRMRLSGLHLGDVRLGDAPDVAVDADADRLAQALLNLVINAGVHTPPGTSVALTCRVSEGWVVFTVIDDGPGMEEAIRRDAFEAFVSGTGGSTGLGLAVVRAVAEGHGGDVRLDSARAGTAVTLRIPAQGAVIAGSSAGAATPDAMALQRGLNA